MSAGNRSGVNWMRWKTPAKLRAMALPTSVLPTPGTSSNKTCSPANRATTTSRTVSALPSTTREMFCCNRADQIGRFVRHVVPPGCRLMRTAVPGSHGDIVLYGSVTGKPLSRIPHHAAKTSDAASGGADIPVCQIRRDFLRQTGMSTPPS